ncbi:uncharacterized protein PAC_02147 [Phialocephala subalpina]|uniref:DNA (cytosine-5-)-methyltransferase n=1 Tax=Phialocephala subalpina TaxID=576137 RepID=A0A1L7WHN1_9HELO|nr:uncharacterized protein PAC_02147 [Phialocephala subalpina]
MEGNSRKRFNHDLDSPSPSPTRQRTLKWSFQDSDPAMEEHFDENTEDELESSESPTLSWTSWPVPPESEGDGDYNEVYDEDISDYEMENVDVVKTTSFVFSEVSKFYPNVLREITTLGSPSLNVPWDLESWKKNVRMTAKRNVPNRVKLKSDPFYTDELGRMYHNQVDIDGIAYYPRDFVLTESCQFARIISIYHDRESSAGYMTHVQMFQHGSDIAVLNQMASPVELFFTQECKDIEIYSFRSKLKVTYEPASTEIVERKYELGEGEYFYRQCYNSDKQQFHDLPEMEGQPQRLECPFCIQGSNDQAKKCTILGSNQKLLKKKIFLEGVRYAGTDYHIHDFVYIFEERDLKQPFTIGQITQIYTKRRHWLSPSRHKKSMDCRCINIIVDIFERYDKLLRASWFYEFEVGGKHAVRDERRLYRTRTEMKITPDELEGKCWVRPYAEIVGNSGHRELDAFKDNPDYFWVKDQVGEDLDPDSEIGREALIPLTELQFSQQMKAEIESKKRRLESFLTLPGAKLRGLDIFSGAGGLSLGMQSSGLVDPDTLHAIEFDGAACKTHAANFPNCVIHNADACELLERAVRSERGELLQPSYDEGGIVPELPRSGEVDIIYGGKPTMPRLLNRQPSQEGRRSKECPCRYVLGLCGAVQTQILSAGECQRAPLEQGNWQDNAPPQLDIAVDLLNQLGAIEVPGENSGAIRLEGGIEQGTVKLIFRTLTGMGYQVQYALLEAAEYDVASTRKRVIFWASLPGYPLPFFPQPTNVLPPKLSRMGDGILSNWYRNHRSAPHEMITMGAATTDLPAFDWENTKESAVKRAIQSYPVNIAYLFVGKNIQPYPSARPFSEYQRRLRKVPLNKGLLRNHVTDRYKPDLVNRVCIVPVVESDNSTGKKSYRRLDFELPFTAAVTTVRPDQKCGKTIHAVQHRIITIREDARAMSFPDSFVFPLNATGIKVSDSYKQIGNAVPPNFAHVLARELVIARMEKDEQEKAQGSKTGRASATPKNTGKIVDFIDLTDDDD